MSYQLSNSSDPSKIQQELQSLNSRIESITKEKINLNIELDEILKKKQQLEAYQKQSLAQKKQEQVSSKQQAINVSSFSYNPENSQQLHHSLDIYGNQKVIASSSQSKASHELEQQSDESFSSNKKGYTKTALRTNFSDAFKNYAVRLAKRYPRKIACKQLGILYTNLYRWEQESESGQLPRDTSYMPNKEDLKKEAEMKRLTAKENLKKQKQAMPQDNDSLLEELITSADKIVKVQKAQNQSSEPTSNKAGDGNTDILEDDNTYQQKRAFEELKARFEVKLVEKLKEEQAALTKKEFLNIAKELRLKMGIDDTELVLSKTWFLAFTKKQNIMVEKQVE